MSEQKDDKPPSGDSGVKTEQDESASPAPESPHPPEAKGEQPAATPGGAESSGEPTDQQDEEAPPVSSGVGQNQSTDQTVEGQHPATESTEPPPPDVPESVAGDEEQLASEASNENSEGDGPELPDAPEPESREVESSGAEEQQEENAPRIPALEENEDIAASEPEAEATPQTPEEEQAAGGQDGDPEAANETPGDGFEQVEHSENPEGMEAEVPAAAGHEEGAAESPNESGAGGEVEDSGTGAGGGDGRGARRPGDSDELARKRAALPEGYYLRSGEAVRSNVEDGLPKLKWNDVQEKWEDRGDEPVERARYVKADFPPENVSDDRKNDFKAAIDRRAAAIETVKQSSATPGVDSDPALQQQVKAAFAEQTSAGEQLGEQAAQVAMQDLYGGDATMDPRHPHEGGPHRFDQVYQVGEGQYVVVEAKAPTSPLGSRRDGGTRYEQGHPRYLESILGQMERRGGDELDLAGALRNAWDDEKFDYYVVRAQVKVSPGQGGSPDIHEYAGYIIKKFNIYREE